MSEFWRVVYGPEAMTITFVVQSSLEDLDTEVRRLLKLKGIRSAGPGVMMWSAESIHCPDGEWSSEKWQAIQQLELEYNVFLHSISKEDANEALKEEYPFGLMPEKWMEIRKEMRDNHYGLTGGSNREHEFIEEVHTSMVNYEKVKRLRQEQSVYCGICNEQWFDDLIPVTYAQRPTYVCGPCYDKHCK